MVFIDVCVGSSCHLTGAPEIVELIQKEVEGVSVKVDEEVYTGITRDNFRDFFENTIMTAIKNSEV